MANHWDSLPSDLQERIHQLALKDVRDAAAREAACKGARMTFARAKALIEEAVEDGADEDSVMDLLNVILHSPPHPDSPCHGYKCWTRCISPECKWDVLSWFERLIYLDINTAAHASGLFDPDL